MNEALHRLVYYSRNRMGGSPGEMAETVRTILTASRSNNHKVGVTGALMFNSGCFGQVLEGPREGVENTFERIQQDARHGDVLLLAFGPTSHRSFDQWSMAFVGEAEEDAMRYGAVAGESGFDPSRMTGEALFETLQRLIIEEEGARRSVA